MRLTGLRKAVGWTTVVVLLSLGTPVAGTQSATYEETLSIQFEGNSRPPVTGLLLAEQPNVTIHCNNFTYFDDDNGRYTIQHQCGGNTAPWGFKIAASRCAIAVSLVAEEGMNWTRNGLRQGRQASHLEACDYQFHGNYNPARDGDHITYSDVLTFKVNVGGTPGTATLNVRGDFTLSGLPPG